MRPRGNSQTLEDRHRRAVTLVLNGATAAAAADEVGTTVRSVRRWLQAYREQGEAGFTPKPTLGRPNRLTAAQKERLFDLLNQGPRQYGLSTDRWLPELIVELIDFEFGVRYNPCYLSHLLSRYGMNVRKLNEFRPWCEGDIS
jgi:transposase